MTELACRRCGQVTPDRVLIYGKDDLGAMVAKQAQCRGVCPKAVQQRQPRDMRGGPGPFTSIRPGLCGAECGLDIVPGDRIVRLGDDHYHEACAPKEAVRPQAQRRERVRTRQG